MALSLAQKLRIKEGNKLYAMNAPESFNKQLGELPPAVKFATKIETCNQIHWFVLNKNQFNKELKLVLDSLKNEMICWIYFPKGSSGIQTDLTRDKGWDELTNQNEKYTWLTLISFDDTWSAFGFRLKTDSDKKKEITQKPREIFNYIDAATKTVHIPEDLAKAFAKNKQAKIIFDKLPFTHRKEYVEWIITAKKIETRLKRVEGTMEKLVQKINK